VFANTSANFRLFLAKALVVVAVLAAIAGYGFVNAASWLAAPGQDAVAADAAFVLGGSNGDRELQAADLYRRGLVKTFVATGMEEAIPEIELLEFHWRVHMLKRVGVPADAIVLDGHSSNSEEEAALGLKLAQARGWKRVLVVSDPPHMRRLDLIWGRAFARSGIEVRFVPSRPKWWVPDRWWKSRKSAQFVVSEYIKLVYVLF
jgi:uncharacterized SAM-binding protein YcdF (DUF218 family)